MNLAALYSMISSYINLEATKDALIPPAVRLVAEDLERNNTFLYMEKYRAVSLATGATELAFTGRIKGLKLFREVLSDGTYKNLQQIDAMDLDQPDFSQSGTPDFFWVDGNYRAIFNVTLPAAGNYQLIEVLLTDWPTDTTQEPWLAKFGAGLLLHATLVQLTPVLRDAELSAAASPLVVTALNTLLAVDDELRQSLRNETMRYGREV